MVFRRDVRPAATLIWGDLELPKERVERVAWADEFIQ
jgi:hypothetical protein